MRSAGETVTLTVYRIPGLAKLTFQDRIPRGETIEVRVELEIPAETT